MVDPHCQWPARFMSRKRSEVMPTVVHSPFRLARAPLWLAVNVVAAISVAVLIQPVIGRNIPQKSTREPAPGSSAARPQSSSPAPATGRENGKDSSAQPEKASTNSAPADNTSNKVVQE